MQGFVFGNSMGLVTSKSVVGGISVGDVEDSDNCDLKRESDEMGIFAVQ